MLTCALTSIRRVGCGAIEESGRAAQVGHAGVVSVAVHGAGDWGVTGLLRRGAGHVTVWRHTTAAAHEPCRKCGGEEEEHVAIEQLVKMMRTQITRDRNLNSVRVYVGNVYKTCSKVGRLFLYTEVNFVNGRKFKDKKCKYVMTLCLSNLCNIHWSLVTKVRPFLSKRKYDSVFLGQKRW